MSYRIKGMDKLMRKLNRLERSGARRANRKAVRAGTVVLARAVRKATPVDKGLLKKSIASKLIGKGLAAGGIVGSDQDKLDTDAGTVEGRPSNIDFLTEFGHVMPDGRMVPPSGHMRSASAAAMPTAEAKVAEVMAREIEKEALK